MVSQISSRMLKIQTAVAEGVTVRTFENVLRDIHHNEKFNILGINLGVVQEAASLHEVTIFRNRSTGPGPVSGAMTAVEYEGQFFAWVSKTVHAGWTNVFYNFPKPIDFDKNDSLCVRFDTGTQGAGESCAMELLIFYEIVK
ncbi:hypothetical protein ES705_42856 [subsurface metagenome]